MTQSLKYLTREALVCASLFYFDYIWHVPPSSFTPHSHAGSDLGRGGTDYRRSVSIHTPTRGVTAEMHTPPGYHSFNPHSHAGSDSLLEFSLEEMLVSIHTPMRGVTNGS